MKGELLLVAGGVGVGKSKALLREIDSKLSEMEEVITIGLEYNEGDLLKLSQPEKIKLLNNFNELEDLAKTGDIFSEKMLVIDNISLNFPKEKVKDILNMGFKGILVSSQIKRGSTEPKEDFLKKEFTNLFKIPESTNTKIQILTNKIGGQK